MTTTATHVTQNGQYYPKPTKTLDISTNDIVAIGDVNSYLPNNGTRYNIKDGYIPNNSFVNFQTGDSLIIAIFNSDRGILCNETNWIEGEWRVISKVPFL